MTAGLVALIVGAALGFVLSIPAAGPLLALVVLAGARGDGRRALALAVGGALAESAWALLAFWGLSELVTTRAELIPILRGLSALLLALLAIVLWKSSSAAESEPDARRGFSPAVLGFVLVALNPGFPLTWGGVAAALYSSSLLPPGSALVPLLAIGVFVGIVAWFALVARLARRVGKRFDERARRRLSRVVALLLFALAGSLVVLAVRA